MGELFAPFTEVAARNPLAAAPTVRTAAELATPSERNRPIVDPYPRFLVARDQVNQGAAVLLMSVGAARRLGVPEDRWVFLHGHADLREPDLLDREDLSGYPASVLAVQHALDVAGVGARRRHVPRPLQLLPDRGVQPAATASASPPTTRAASPSPAGCRSSAAPATTTRCTPSRRPCSAAAPTRTSSAWSAPTAACSPSYSVGVYSTRPAPWRDDRSAELQAEIDAWPAAGVHRAPRGLGAHRDLHGALRPRRSRPASWSAAWRTPASGSSPRRWRTTTRSSTCSARRSRSASGSTCAPSSTATGSPPPRSGWTPRSPSASTDADRAETARQAAEFEAVL